MSSVPQYDGVMMSSVPQYDGVSDKCLNDNSTSGCYKRQLYVVVTSLLALARVSPNCPSVEKIISLALIPQKNTHKE